MKIIANYNIVFFLLSTCLFSQNQGRFHQGKPEKEFYNNESIRIERWFNEGVISKYKTYFKSGELQSEHFFNSRGEHDGKAFHYHQNGNIRTKWIYNNGVVLKRKEFNKDNSPITNTHRMNTIARCNQNLIENKFNLQAIHERANVRAGLGYFDLALEDYYYLESKFKGKTIGDKYNYVWTNIFRATIYYGMDRFYDSIEYNLKAIQADPTVSSAYLNLVYSLNAINESELALKFIERAPVFPAIELSIVNAKAYTYLGLKKYKEALHFTEIALKNEKKLLESRIETYNEKKLVIMKEFLNHKLKNTKIDLVNIESELKINNSNSYAYYVKGIILAETGQLEEACQAFEMAKENNYDEKYETEDIAKLIEHYCTNKSDKNLNLNNLSKLVLYPNPAKDFISFNIEREFNYEIYDYNSRLLSKGVYIGDKIEISELPTSIYILKIYDKEKIYTRKFIKE